MQLQRTDPQVYYRALVGARRRAETVGRQIGNRPGMIPAAALSAALRDLRARAIKRLAEARQRMAA